MASLQQLANYAWSPKLNLKLLCSSALHLLRQSNNRCFTNRSLVKCNTKSIMRFYCNNNRFYSFSRDLQKYRQFLEEFKLWGAKTQSWCQSWKWYKQQRHQGQGAVPCHLLCTQNPRRHRFRPWTKRQWVNSPPGEAHWHLTSGLSPQCHSVLIEDEPGLYQHNQEAGNSPKIC